WGGCRAPAKTIACPALGASRPERQDPPTEAVHNPARPSMHHRALRHAAPVAAALLGLAALATPTYAAGVGVVVPGVDVDYNIGAVTLAGFPTGSAETITLTRDGVPIATSTGTTDGAGILNLNVPNILPPETFTCWTGFTPDILAGDTVTVTDATTGTNSIDARLQRRPPGRGRRRDRTARHGRRSDHRRADPRR